MTTTTDNDDMAETVGAGQKPASFRFKSREDMNRMFAAQGAKARNKKLSPERRREIAIIASRAALEKRKQKRLEQGHP